MPANERACQVATRKPETVARRVAVGETIVPPTQTDNCPGVSAGAVPNDSVDPPC
jgi:hypothetical protein